MSRGDEARVTDVVLARGKDRHGSHGAGPLLDVGRLSVNRRHAAHQRASRKARWRGKELTSMSDPQLSADEPLTLVDVSVHDFLNSGFLRRQP